jgi:predicted acyl esterase
VVQVQSSGFPEIDRNPQTFCDIYRAKPADYRPATQRVYRAPNAASGLRVLVAPR